MSGLLLLLLQFTSFTKLWVFLSGMRIPLSEYVQVLSEIPWKRYDLILIGLFVLSVISVVVCEAITKGWTRLLAWIISTERRTQVAVVAASFLAARYYFSPGNLGWVADAALHTLYTWIAGEAIGQGLMPAWTPLVAAGTPFLQFYGFLYFYIAGAAYALVDDLAFVTKLVPGVCHVLSGLTMYLFVRSAFHSRQAGLFAALAYVLSVWHMQHVLLMGRLPVGLFYALLPLPFHCLKAASRSDDARRWIVAGAAATAALFYTHPGFALWTCGFMVLYTFIIGLLEPGSRNRLVVRGLVLVGLGVALSAYLVIPMWAERAYTGLRDGVDFTRFGGAPTWRQIFLWSNYHVRLFDTDLDNWSGAYVGTVPLVFAAWGLVSAPWQTRGPFRSAATMAAAGTIISFVLLLGYRGLSPYTGIILQTITASRFQLFIAFFLSVSAGYAVGSVTFREKSILPIGLLLLFLDLGLSTVRMPYHQYDPLISAGVKKERLESIQRNASMEKRHQYEGARVLNPSKSHNNQMMVLGGVASSVVMYEEHTLVDGHFLRPLTQFAGHALREKASGGSKAWLATDEGRRTLEALVLTNTRDFMTFAKGESRLLDLRLPLASPIHVSSVAESAALIDRMSSDSVLTLVGRMALSPKDRRVEKILVVHRASEILAGEEEPSVTVGKEEVYVDRVRLEVETNRPCFARLAFGYYPQLSVLVNGQDAETWMTAGGFTALRLSGGRSVIEIAGRFSNLRKALLAFDIMLLLGLLAWRGAFTAIGDRLRKLITQTQER